MSEQLLRSIPKAELHCHFEGSVPAPLFIELATKNGVKLPTLDPDSVYDVFPEREAFVRQMEHVPDWVFRGFSRKYQRQFRTADEIYGLGLYEAFLDRFDLVCESMVSADDFSRAVYASLIEAADRANVRYREMFFHPMNHPGVAYRTMLEGLLDGIRSARTDRGITCNLIPAINRECSARAAVELVENVIGHRCDEVVGLASDYDEEHLPAFAKAFEMAAAAGLPATGHAGEYGAASTVAECIDVLGCRRIDHGYAIADDAELMARARDLGVHFACIFSASILIFSPDEWPLHSCAPEDLRALESPVGRMLDAGLSISLGSNDPAFAGFADLGTEYVWTATALDLDVDQMMALSIAAVDASWQSQEDRADMRREFVAEAARLQSAHGVP